MEKVTHQAIHERLLTVEAKVDKLNDETAQVVKAFEAARGAFTVLEWVATLVKPLLWVAGVVASFSLMIAEYKK